MISKITSLENPTIKYAYKLKSISNVKKEGKYLSEGKFNLEMALSSKVVDSIFSMHPLKDIDDSITQYLVSDKIMKKLSSLVTNFDVIFICHIKEIPLDKKERLIYLDDIRDPGNMGTILRSALALGYDGVILSPNCVSIYNSKVISSCKGAIYKLPIVVDTLSKYKSTHTIYISEADSQDTLKDIKPHAPFILVFGNEAHGVSESTKALGDYTVSIKMNDIDSLNVAVASGIIMYNFIS